VDGEFYLLSNAFVSGDALGRPDRRPAGAKPPVESWASRPSHILPRTWLSTITKTFPVASILLPPALREPVAAIYWFARNADDFADEGDLPPEAARALLAGYQAELDAIEARSRRPGTRCSSACGR
jgi:hypothetical protein